VDLAQVILSQTAQRRGTDACGLAVDHAWFPLFFVLMTYARSASADLQLQLYINILSVYKRRNSRFKAKIMKSY
jgi:hypothetical protein